MEARSIRLSSAVLLLLALGALVGCAAPQRIDAGDHARDAWACDESVANSRVPRFTLAGAALYHECMVAHGWSK